MEKQVQVRAFYRFISKIYGITLFLFGEAETLIERYSSSPASVEFLLSFSNLKEQIFNLCRKTRQPQVVSSEFGQLWAGIPVVDGDHIPAMIVVGPVFTSGGSTNLMLDYVRSYNISTISREMLVDALNQTPVCSYREFTRLIAIVYAFTCDRELDTTELPIAGLTSQELPDDLRQAVWGAHEGSQESSVLSTIAFGKRLMECIQEGNLINLKRLLKTSDYSQMHYLSLPDPIRQQKDMFLILITQVVHTVIQAGLNPEVAYALNDRYIQRVETMTNMIPIITLTREMLYDFTSQVGKIRRPKEYSKLVNDSCNYIHEHIYENLHVTDVARFTGYNPHYLSQRFREETGQSICDYIREAKISEAKSLLKYTSLSLAEISERLAFSSQSFFTATFRRLTGMTPARFREWSKNSMQS